MYKIYVSYTNMYQPIFFLIAEQGWSIDGVRLRLLPHDAEHPWRRGRCVRPRSAGGHNSPGQTKLRGRHEEPAQSRV